MFPFRGVHGLFGAGSHMLALQGLLAACTAGSFALVPEALPALFEPVALTLDHLSSRCKVSPATLFSLKGYSSKWLDSKQVLCTMRRIEG